MNSNFKNRLLETYNINEETAIKISTVVDGTINSPQIPEKSKLTSSAKLAAALKLSEQYENMDADTALQIVNTVFANEESEEDTSTEPENTSDSEDNTEQPSEDDLEGIFDE